MSNSSPAPSPPNVGVVVVAAGRGLRAGGERPKQFRLVDGVPVLLHAVNPFRAHPSVSHLVVVLPPDQAADPPGWLARDRGPTLTTVAGGPERIDSVANGVAALPASCPVIVVHDGARPFPDPAVVDQVISLALGGRSAIAAIPVADTLKEAGDPVDGQVPIARTVARDRLWRAQTPQAFPAEILRRALAEGRKRGVIATDEAALVEALGSPVLLVPDLPSNLKLTSASDFTVAEALARSRR